MSTSVLTEQQRFADLLETPELEAYAKFWDFSAEGYDRIHFSAIENTIRTAVPTERVLLQFLACLWLGENVFKFDLFEAVYVLDKPQMNIIRRWVLSPFFPKF